MAQIVLITAGVFSDAGGFIIYVGSDGKLHVKKVPPWGPDGFRVDIDRGLSLLTAAARVKDARLAGELEKTGLQALQQHVGELRKLGEIQT